MPFTERVKMLLSVAALMASGRKMGRLILLKAEELANGPVQTPINSSFSVRPATGRKLTKGGQPTPPVYQEEPTYSHWPWSNGDPPEDGDGGE